MAQETMNLFSSGSGVPDSKITGDTFHDSGERCCRQGGEKKQHSGKVHDATPEKLKKDGTEQCMRSSSVFSGKDETLGRTSPIHLGQNEECHSTAKHLSAETRETQKDLTQASVFFCDNKNSEIQFNDEQMQQPAVKKKTIIENSIEFADEETDAGFIADAVEFTAGADARETREQANRQENPVVIRMYKPKFLTAAADMAKFFILKSKFENGTLVQALDKDKKPLMLLFQLGNELMAYRYLGTSLEIEIPDTVGKCPVRYLHPDFLSGGSSILSGVKMQNLKSNFSTENIANISKESIKTSLMGARSLLLPEGLTMLPPRLFYHCYALHKIVIPSSVTSVSIDAFQGSGLKHIYFNGECPIGFKHSVDLPTGITIHFKNAHRSSFLEG